MLASEAHKFIWDKVIEKMKELGDDFDIDELFLVKREAVMSLGEEGLILLDNMSELIGRRHSCVLCLVFRCQMARLSSKPMCPLRTCDEKLGSLYYRVYKDRDIKAAVKIRDVVFSDKEDNEL